MVYVGKVGLEVIAGSMVISEMSSRRSSESLASLSKPSAHSSSEEYSPNSPGKYCELPMIFSATCSGNLALPRASTMDHLLRGWASTSDNA